MSSYSPHFISLTLIIEGKDKTFLFRPYDHEIHYGQLKSICKNVRTVLREAEFVPQIAQALSKDVLCAPYVLCDASNVAAFVNLRLRKHHENGNGVLISCDCLRVREDLHAKGVGFAISKAVMRVVNATFWHHQAERRKVSLLAVTDINNTAMGHIARKLGWSSHEVMHLWPTPAMVWDAKHRNIPLLDALHMSQFITAEASALFKQWVKITSDEILSTMQILRQRGASYQRPLYFDVESAECAGAFLNHDLATEELRSVWRLDRDGEVRGLLFVRARIIEKTQPCKHSLISACVIDVEGAESCVFFAATRLHLSFFHIVFDDPIRSEHLSRSRLLSQAPSEPFVIYRYDLTSGECSAS
ncbi:hypothetical protein BWQ96_09723 [Gracilariopsis chorda]|uniref:N-acetyltransferase domain-containing protein n=1 Tax=Gracilariopsis chorda TaxID=448386 RepID=A0A2V3IEX2_9FLOR|nr:hypothetical protein BWQ96_09723 [Gracilariopsis chorda]|eukprot:PXF40568.1 hypothetical protein BWQ96_09723 [Gracilariopsis chorda]